MHPDRQLHESDARARLIDTFPTDGAINILNRTAGQPAAVANGDTTPCSFGPTDLPEHFPWPHADGGQGADGSGELA